MDFRTRTLVWLAHEPSRPQVLTSSLLEELILAGFDVAGAPPQAPFRAVTDKLLLGPDVAPQPVFEGVARLGAPHEWSLRGTLEGWGAEASPDAWWRGAVVADAVRATAPVEEVEGGMDLLRGVDAEVRATTGALPTQPPALEAARRVVVVRRLQAAGLVGAEVDETLDRWRRRAGTDDLSGLLARVDASVGQGALTLRFAAADGAPPTPVRYAFSALVYIRGADVDLLQLLRDTRRGRRQAAERGMVSPADYGPRRLHDVLAIWILPAAILDDADWPGAASPTTGPAAREARRVAATTWLAPEGIALALLD